MKSLLFLIFLLIAGSTHAADPQLRLTASPPPDARPFMPVTVKLTLENIGKESVRILRLPEIRTTQIEVQEAATGAIIYKGSVEVSRFQSEQQESSPVVLQPADKHLFFVTLKCRWNEKGISGPMFDRAGTYKIRFLASVTYWDGKDRLGAWVQSEWTNLSVKPLSPREKEALNKLTGTGNYCWVLEPQEALAFTTEKEQKKWETALSEFIQHAPDSYLNPYARLALAYLYQSRAAGTKDVRLKSNNLALARQHLELALEREAFPEKAQAERLREAIQSLE